MEGINFKIITLKIKEIYSMVMPRVYTGLSVSLTVPTDAYLPQ